MMIMLLYLIFSVLMKQKMFVMWFIRITKTKKREVQFSPYLCIPTGQISVYFTILIFVSFEHGQQGCGEVTAGFIPDDILEIYAVFWKTFRHSWSCYVVILFVLLTSNCGTSSQTFFEDPLDFENLLVCSCCENFHQDVFICAETL